MSIGGIDVRFKRFPEHKPKQGQKIWLVEISTFYSSYDFRHGAVDLLWEEIDPEDGLPTGDLFEYVPGKKKPKNTEKIYMLDGEQIADGTFWVSCDALEKSLFADKKDSRV